MKNMLHIIRNEITTTLGRPSYLLLTVGIPVAGILVFTAITLIKGDSADTSAVPDSQPGSSELAVEGYVDHAGLIESHPPDISADTLLPFPDETSAGEALEAGEIDSYYIISEDYVKSGNIYIVQPEISPFSKWNQDWIIRWTLLYNLAGQDAELASMIWNPTDLQTTNLTAIAAAETGEVGECTTPGYTCDSNPLIRMLPLFVLILFFIFISTGSGLLLRSVSSENQNRTMETLLLSVRPREMLGGKVIGLGLVALLQMALWFGTAFVILRIGGSTLNLPPGFSLPVSLLVWAFVLFIGGYAIDASLMAGLGALVPDIKAGSQVSFIIMLPLMVGYIISVMPPVQDAPHGLLPTVLSIFPFSAPTVMMFRLTVGGVPTWQLIASALILTVCAIGAVWLAGRAFRVGMLRYGQKLNWRKMFLVNGS